MKKLDWYVAKDMILPFVAGTVVLAALFMLNELMALIQRQVSSVPPAAIFQLALLAMPKWILLVLPVGLSFSISLVMSRLMRESELTALRASGVKISRVVKPMAIVAIAMAALSYFLVEKVTPDANKRWTKVSQEFLRVAGQGDFINDVPVMLGRYLAKIQSISRNQDGTLTLTNIVLHEQANGNENIFYISPSGEYRDGIFTLNNTKIYYLMDDNLMAVQARDIVINQKIEVADFFPQPNIENESISGVWKQVNDLHQLKKDARKPEGVLQSLIVSPLTCILFAIMAAYSSVRFAPRGAFVGVFASLIWPYVYFNVAIAGQSMINNGWVPAVAGVWGPIGVLVVVAFFIVRGLE